MTEQTFLKQFEAAQLKTFPHRDHIRMAWLYLRRDGWEQGYLQIQQGLQHFANTIGFTDKYHETITRFWAHLVYHCIQNNPEITDFEAFVVAYPITLDKTAISQHYSPELLKSASARQTWQAPDLVPMPSLSDKS